jgi:RNA polymerase-binding transcription factor DksA
VLEPRTAPVPAEDIRSTLEAAYELPFGCALRLDGSPANGVKLDVDLKIAVGVASHRLCHVVLLPPLHATYRRAPDESRAQRPADMVRLALRAARWTAQAPGMNTTLAARRHRLERLREELRREIATDAAILARALDEKGEDTSVSQHPADVASDLYAREELVAEEIAMTSELGQVEDALRQIAEGTYGICVTCGMPIARERLDARPQATRCIACQRKVDR